MALPKQSINIPFGQGIDTKTDPNQVAMGKMIALSNVVFDNGGALHKRFGFDLSSAMPTGAAATTLTTLNDNLIATGANLYAYSNDSMQWLNRGSVQPVDVNVLPVTRASTGQTSCDSATASNGLVCVSYEDGGVGSYQITDSTTGQIILAKTQLSSTARMPRSFVLGAYFIVTFLQTITATPHLSYIAIPITNPTAPLTYADLSTDVSAVTAAYDACIANNTLYAAWNGSDVGGAVRMAKMTSTLVVSAATTVATYVANLISVVADESGSTPVIWVSWYRASDTTTRAMARDYNLLSVLAPTTVLATTTCQGITSIVVSSVLSIYLQVRNTYGYSATRSDYVLTRTINQAGSVSASTTVKRSVGIASKAFSYASTVYLLVTYNSTLQPGYFLIDSAGHIIMRLALSNGYGYAFDQVLASITNVDGILQFTYLFRDLLTSVNKTQGSTVTAGIYTQAGVNLAKIAINSTGQFSAETAGSLHLTGGQLWQYDAVAPVEHGFNIYPEALLTTVVGSGGSMTAQQYYYQATYEWTDAQGMLHRSAPSIPIGALCAAGSNSVTINIPTLRLSAKASVRIVIYRWSTAQQSYYQITSISSPTLNDTTVDSIVYTDTQADSDILGNALVYTTGAVVENIAAPSCAAAVLYKARMLLLDAEDRNTIWYSKPLVQAEPVEFSDLFTLYAPPNASAQAGPITALGAMDDKAILFRKNAIYYFTGNGPDATGANNDFSEATFVTSVAGCTNQASVVLSPVGLMFQSNKGIWLLGRDLSTKYVGAAVEAYNTDTVVSALSIPGTNQIRFTLDNGLVLMYDYFYDQWCTFDNINSVASTLWQNKHTHLNDSAQVVQESTGYLDISRPVLMSLTTAWLKLTNLQGYQRAYWFTLLGNYKTPHTLSIQVAYDYDSNPLQVATIEPDNFSPAYGYGPDTETQEVPYGGTSPYGGVSAREQWRVFFERQRCEAIQITVTEIYDPSFSVPAGAGLSLSGINLVASGKKPYPNINSGQSTS